MIKKNIIMIGLLMVLLLYMSLSAVSAGEIKMKQEGASGVIGTVEIWNADTNKKIYSKTFNAGDTSSTYKVPNEYKFHQLSIRYEWKGAVKHAANFVSINSYNGGTVDITFGKKYYTKYWTSYSYVYGQYYYPKEDGTKLNLQEVTKDQATQGGKDNRNNWIHCITWT
jgi:hypothetical protein